MAGDEIYQLTWKSGVAIVYDKQTFAEKRRFRYIGEGWGLTYDGTHLIMSNGTYQLQYLDPQTGRVVRRLSVTTNGNALGDLNELEYIDGEIFANVWGTDWIARIDPANGKVTSWIDARGLIRLRRTPNSQKVLNGIAYDPATKRLFVTGKNWPSLFEIELVEP